ncbi:electron transfer flavoprotein-ubiquinone oxidoreductase [Altererythrobacter sp. Root672]|uniref:electron transfer flavoprotein-ubiquinone oxidoreductase n=1 Tax=Altererythrobacter sp. Root672 TaxID=1736584 RepID=UPI0006FA8B99|nr:electron transfer flavoprotein-ubiquinone oxidoreductase [Altererythrobacter sp. Root672]KRA83513.1 electron transfer flavoprotein-ubiquinone oxidoreductase [Altererythrobacter sp. Root672]
MSDQHPEREAMPVDVVIAGAGPAGLAAAIRLKQLNEDLEVVVLEKGSEVGAHILSGAVIDPRALDELLPDWRENCALAEVPVTENHHWFLTRNGKWGMPHFLLPPLMSNDGCFTGSLGNLCRWLAEQAEALGVQVFPGFPASEVLFDENGSVMGLATQDMGVAANGSHKPDYQPGMELHAKYTLLAEGARGHLTKRLKAHFALDAESEPQVYGLGIKELWEIPADRHEPGRVIHTQGWPLSENDTWGGGFLYHQANGQVALGFVTALDYANPYISPFEEFQRWKQHSAIREVIEGGRRVSYGARAINEGGWQSVPKLAFPGGALIGCSAGFVNVPRIKGSHTAMKSGMLAAEAIAAAIATDREKDELAEYDSAVRSSWIADELKQVQNAQPLVSSFGDVLGTLLAGADMWLRTLKIRLPFSLSHHTDAEATGRADLYRPIAYPKPDGKISFDRLSSVFLSGTNHEEDQPCHLLLKDPTIPERVDWPIYAGPETRYCPAGVYEYVGVEEGEPRLVINAQNCVHCKTCDIKDPPQNIEWVTPEGGGGPNYPNM